MHVFDWFRTSRRQGESSPEHLERLAALERDMKSMRLEWEETYEKVHTSLRKLAKRAERAQAAPCADCGPGDDPGAIPGGSHVNWKDPQVKARTLASIRARNGHGG